METKTTKLGIEVIVNGDSMQVPQPDKSMTKSELLSQKMVWQSQLDYVTNELNKLDDLLELFEQND